MTNQINIGDAKTHFSKLLKRVENGEEIIITKAGIPVARMIPFEHRFSTRQPGSTAGQIQMEPDFDDPLPEEILATFEGRSE